MSKRGQATLIGVAIVIGVAALLFRGCVWLVAHTPEPQVVEIKHDQNFELAKTAAQLANNKYSRDLVFDYRVVGQEKGRRLKNGKILTLLLGTRYEGYPWKKGYGNDDEMLYEPPLVM